MSLSKYDLNVLVTHSIQERQVISTIGYNLYSVHS